MDEVGTKSKARIIMIVVAAVAVVAILGGAVYALILANQPKKETASNVKNQAKTVSAEDLQTGLTNLNSTAVKERANLGKVQTALNDSDKRIKLGN